MINLLYYWRLECRFFTYNIKKGKKSKNNLKFKKKIFSKNGYLVKENYLNENLINNLRSELKTIKGYWAGDNFKSKGLEFFKIKRNYKVLLYSKRIT